MTTDGAPRWVVVAVFVAAALPSLLWAVNGSGLIHDDWGFAAQAEFRGVWQTVAESSTRPLAALYFGLTFGALGTNSAAHALVLAGLNGVAGVLFLLVSYRLLGRQLAVWTTLVWLALPNRGSTRLWIAMGPAVLALCLFLLGVLLLLSDHAFTAALAMGVSILAYEAATAVALALMVFAWRSPTRRISTLALSAAPVIAAAAWIFLRSPKRGSGQVPFSHSGAVIAAHFGAGTFGPLAPVGTVVLLAFALAVARTMLPGFRAGVTSYDRATLAGAGIVGLGAVPFMVAGFPFATDGIFDRGNLVAGLGTALVLGALLAGLSKPRRRLRGAAALGVVLYLASLNAEDLRDYRQAISDGEILQAQLARDVPHLDAPLVVGPPLPNRGGVAQFIAYHDLGSALQVVRDDRTLVARIAVSEADFESAPESLRYDRTTRRLERRESAQDRGLP